MSKTRTYPRLTCNECGETKIATRFPKRGGPYYERVPTNDPRRYAPKCKRCTKPAKPGQSREEVKEPVLPTYSRAMKKVAKRKKQEKPRKKAMSPAEAKLKRRIEARVKSMIYLSEHGCEECGERDPRKLEYDHKDPSTKTATVSRLILDGFSWTSDRLRSEISQCRVLCANCHRKHTVEQQGYYREPEVQRTLGLLAARYKFDL